MGISNEHILLREQAIKLRLQGHSYRQISDEINVAKSTLNGWLRNVEITQPQKDQLLLKWKEGLKKARIRSVEVKKLEKLENIHKSKITAKKILNSVSFTSEILEIFLAGLYLGDGFKVNGRFGLGNSNPLIVKLFLTLIRQLYKIDESKLGVQIFARADQNTEILLNYWSNLLKIPISQFQKTQHDSRAKKPTRKNYYGVCAVNYSNVVLQRRILAIGNEMLKYNNKPNRGL